MMANMTGSNNVDRKLLYTYFISGVENGNISLSSFGLPIQERLEGPAR